MTAARPKDGDPVADAAHAVKLFGSPAGKRFDKAWQANWQATATAHAAVDAARSSRLTAELAAGSCSACHACPDPNLCGEHHAPLASAHDALAEALTAHKASVERFKAGVTIGQVQ